MSNRRTANSHSRNPCENESDDDSSNTENKTEFLQGELSVELFINPTDNAQQNPLEIPETSYSDFFTGQIRNPSVELQQQFSDNFSSEQTQAEKKHLQLQYQR